ncbi:MAG: C39 family peptidase [Clostridia bacterium]|nr:C39 family peptidase [Clostridia bacterium]
MNNKKKILTGIVVILAVLGALASIYFPNSKITNVIDETKNELIKEIVVSEETQSEVADTKNAVENGGKVETKEIAKSTIKEEEEVTDEGADESLLEADALVEQENISYDGDNAGKGLNLLGKWQGLTYYSQADSRWATKLYTSTNNKTQTMKSSACGPTCSAMVVSSAKGAILPTTLASLSVDNGYRTANSGTAWAFYPFVADYFGFKEYHKTDDFNKAMTYLSQKNAVGSSKYYIICSCGSGIFTSSGHYIVLASLDGNTIRVMDPYLYNGKFNTASRRNANVEVKGTSAYVSKANFERYANAKSFWIFSNDKGNEQSNNNQVSKTNKENTSKKSTSKKSTKKKVKNTVGKKKTLKKKCYLYKKKNLSGTKYTYKKNTRVKVLKNISSKIDYVKVIATGRKAYIKISNYK